jgi:hypothetical protein
MPRRTAKQPETSHPISIGQVRGSYYVHRRVITVTSPWGTSKSTQVGNTPPETLARIMLRELIQEEEAKPKLRR